MNTMKAQYIAGLESLSDEALHEALACLESHAVANVNWKEYPYSPAVNFKLGWSDKAIAVMFEVTEEHVKAVAMEDNGHVWEDSCVEFFVRHADGVHYCNFELNCAQTLLAAKRTSRHDPAYFTKEDLSGYRRFGSLKHEPIDMHGTDLKWWAVEVIPLGLLGYEKAPEALRANLYKCGDKCDQPHFLSWSPIDLPNPDFHCPDFFGTIEL